MHTLTLAAAGPSRCFVARWLGVSSRHSWYSRPSVSHPAAGFQGPDRARCSCVSAVGAGVTSIRAKCHNPGPCNCVVSIALIGGVPAAPVDAQHSSHRAAARWAGGRTDRDFLSICYRGLWSSGVSAAADSVWRATTVSLQGLPSYVIICAWLRAVASAQAASKQANMDTITCMPCRDASKPCAQPWHACCCTGTVRQPAAATWWRRPLCMTAPAPSAWRLHTPGQAGEWCFSHNSARRVHFWGGFLIPAATGASSVYAFDLGTASGSQQAAAAG